MGRTATKLLAVIFLTHLAVAGTSRAQQAPDPDVCRKRAEARQLDFWVGSWTVHRPADGVQIGTNVIERLLNDCALLEHWTDARGGQGKSLNFFDPQRRTWRQVWVSATGNVLDYREGVFRDRAMHFSGITIDAAGDTTWQKLIFYHVAADTVRQVFESSKDRGQSWKQDWEGIYIRRR